MTRDLSTLAILHYCERLNVCINHIINKKNKIVAAKWEKSRGRPSKRWMDRVEEDLGRVAGVSTFGKTSGRQRMTLRDIAEDREQWRELVALAAMTESNWTMKT